MNYWYTQCLWFSKNTGLSEISQKQKYTILGFHFQEILEKVKLRKDIGGCLTVQVEGEKADSERHREAGDEDILVATVAAGGHTDVYVLVYTFDGCSLLYVY